MGYPVLCQKSGPVEAEWIGFGEQVPGLFVENARVNIYKNSLFQRA